jgi:hypothetical protein
MTRKDYVLIAKAIQESADKVEIAHALAAILGADNPRFDRARFLAACGVPT